MNNIWTDLFGQSGQGFVILGMAVNVMLGGIGSARGLRIAATQTAGIMSEKPELFGKLFVLMVLPGTQGFYSFIASFLAGLQSFLGNKEISFVGGVSLMFLLCAMGVVELISAIEQGRTSAAAINMVAKQERTFGQAIIMPALVETYAVLGLLISIILILSIK
ncbi:MAG TPA: V-type ATP synthase subunit K [Caldisericia bacterium]|nr:MAG: V-type sodium ATPase subunit K [bacterium ADurb.Bin132]HNW32577.1 V-type ATP synthase subunit K [Caldisericia bacterium]HNY61917.1 V-type ATP synthase subunit K [Caldisericia bacterium]HOC79996.1 V-type ATP synthase subunit K [Caldisericia bacterium]HOG70843.1 V-type ATP synthase subunit K [Caldisericia bacterium]